MQEIMTIKRGGNASAEDRGHLRVHGFPGLDSQSDLIPRAISRHLSQQRMLAVLGWTWVFVQDRSAMIHLFNPSLKIRLRLGQAMVVAAAISCLSSPVAMAQNYPVSGVWVATDDRTPGSKGGACFTLKMLGIESILDGSLPTVLIFSDGERIEVRAGFHSQQSIRSL